MPTRSQQQHGGGGQARKQPAIPSKLRKLGVPEHKQLTFELFFPRPPYRGAQYRAARGKDALYNFVGLVLGHGGATVQRIQKASGAKIEVRDSAGNLNGAHPSSHGDPSLHAWVSASSRPRLDKAVSLLVDVLQPTNTTLRDVTVVPGGSVVLEPIIPRDWPEAATADTQSSGAVATTATAATATTTKSQPPPTANAWATNRLLVQHSAAARQLSPVSPLQRTQGAAGSGAPSSEASEEGDGGSSNGSSAGAADVAPAATTTAVAVLPLPPPGWDPLMPPSPSSSAPSILPASAPGACLAEQPQCQLSASSPASMVAVPQPAPPQQMATVWAKGLHPVDSLERPGTPLSSAERSVLPHLNTSFNGCGDDSSGSGDSSGGAWSLWDQTSPSSTSFFEQLQAAASESFSCLGAAASTSVHLHASAGSGPSLAAMPATGIPAVPAAPFPGLGAPGCVGALGVGAAPLSLGLRPQQRQQVDLLGSQAWSIGSASDAEHEMQQLLAAVASMATLDC